MDTSLASTAIEQYQEKEVPGVISLPEAPKVLPEKCCWIYRRTTGDKPRGANCAEPIYISKHRSYIFCFKHHKAAVDMSFQGRTLTKNSQEPNECYFEYSRDSGVYEVRCHSAYPGGKMKIMVQGKK